MRALLIASLVALYLFQRGDVRAFARFRQVADSAGRRRTFLRWAGKAFLFYLGLPLAGLAILGRIDAIWRFPHEFDAIAAAMPAIDWSDGFLGAAIGAMGAGAVLGAVLAARRSKAARPAPGLDITPMLPRNRAELLAVLPLAINAGISEELFFRLYLPLLLVLSGFPPAYAFAGVALLFGLLHLYQGWLGVVATALLGLVFTSLYLAGQGLLLPIVFHLFINLNAMAFRPAVRMHLARADN